MKTTFLNMLSKRTAQVLSSLVLLTAVSTAYAGPILGELEYGFSVNPEDGSGNTVALGSATFLDFNNPGFALSATDDLAGIGLLDLNDFAINPFAAPSLVWTESGGGFSFELTTLTIVTQTDNNLYLTGTGLFKNAGAGYDDTDAVWSLTTQDTGQPSPTLSFSASTAVPEPGMLTLLGFTLLGLGVLRRTKVKVIS